MLGSLFDRNKTFKPRRKIDVGPSSSAPKYDMMKLVPEVLKETIGTTTNASLKESVKCPEGYDVNDWLSVNIVDLFNQVNLIYSSMVYEECTEKSCSIMNAGPKFEYLWQDTDSERYKTPTKLSAPKYVEVLMDWIDRQLSDENVFPLSQGKSFPEQFKNTCKTIMKRLFRVYAHIFHCHLDEIVRCNAEGHLSVCFKHFIYFGQEFQLLPIKELDPLKDVIAKL
eukprot:CAMPEP_0184692022 /NCGR_PEP_ID=MMETSP0313-20130426/670_1 /TAXON_ID=2792 /ORGANISM="Porphyridium aerugineum, Strain SAG 1380-2" /LENGTH=224 /DNA_ID=CAMNT_0027149817 /DNA_START=45 /DNA_END=719 /DNA_ORIENTATION=+